MYLSHAFLIEKASKGTERDQKYKIFFVYLRRTNKLKIFVKEILINLEKELITRLKL